VQPDDGVDIHGLPAGPLPDGSDVRRLVEAEIPQVAAALARAFHDDPVVGVWMVPDESSRLRRLERVSELFVRRVWFPHGECVTTDRVIGGAMWLPPGAWHLGVLAQLRLLPGMLAALGANLPRPLRLLTAFEAKHPHEAHYYLPAMGISPEWQGRGFGAALLRPVLDRCDSEQLPAYLEATSPRNRALYERHGFEVTGEITVKDSPPLWPMWRPPRG
jgi:GNAT superfamily N-acetyltransferase